MSTVFKTRSVDDRVEDMTYHNRDAVSDNVPKLGAKVPGTVYIPQENRFIAGEKVTWKRKPVDPQPSSTFFQGTNPSMVIYLETGDVNRIHKAYLEFKMQTANVQGFTGFPPIFYWLDRMEYWVRGGRQLQILYPEDFTMWLHTMSKLDLKIHKDMYHYDVFETEDYNIVGFKDYTDDFKSNVHTFRLPLIGIFETEMIDMHRISHDIEIRLYFKDDYLDMPQKYDPAYVKSDLTLNSLNWVFKHSHTTAPSFWVGKNTRDHFVHTTIIRENARTLNSGATVKFTLQQLDGIVPYLLFLVRDTTNPYGIQRFNPIPVGRNSTFDLVSATNVSLWSIGEAHTEREIRHSNEKQLEAFYRGYYYLPFCSDIKEGRRGIIDGVHVFDGSTQYLNVKFGDGGGAIDDTLLLSRAAAASTVPSYVTFTRDESYNEVQSISPAETVIATIEQAIRRSYSGFCSALVDDMSFALGGANWGAAAVNSLTFVGGADAGKIRYFGTFVEGASDGAQTPSLTSTPNYSSWESGSNYEVAIVAPIIHSLYINDLGEVYVEKVN